MHYRLAARLTFFISRCRISSKAFCALFKAVRVVTPQNRCGRDFRVTPISKVRSYLQKQRKFNVQAILDD
jgi:hypothetical protein